MAGYSDLFVQTLTVPSGDTSPTQSIIYGNPQYGYFETKEFSEKAKEVTFSLVPPGYQFETEIYVKQKDSRGAFFYQQVALEKFEFPLTPAQLSPKPLQKSAGFTSNYFLSYRERIQKPGGFDSVSLLTNNYGEIVWAYGFSQPGVGKLEVGRYLGRGKYGFLGEQGTFEIANFDGKIEKTVLLEYAPQKRFLLHHDFDYDPAGAGLVAFSINYRKILNPKTSKLEDFIVGTLVNVPMNSSEARVVWDAADKNSPYKVGSCEQLNFNDLASLDGGDFDHVNSVSHVPGKGYLISSRNCSTVVMLDESFHYSWSIGIRPYATISTVGTNFEFHGQHNVHFLPNGNLMLFDNNNTTKRSRVLEIKIDEKAMTAELVKEFVPTPQLFCTHEGSATRLENGNTMGGFIQGSTRRLVEFNPDGEQIAYFNLQSDVHLESYRMQPQNTIGRETYLGKSLSAIRR